MSRAEIATVCPPASFPRVSGDEPGVTVESEPVVRFSPRERG